MSYTPEIQNIISTNNSVVLTNVSGGTIWYGTSEDVTKYGRAGISIWTPFGEFCDGVLTIEVSRDGVNWGGPNRDFSNTAIAQPHMWNIVEQYFRLKYTHGTTSASTLVIQTQYSVNSDILLGHQLDEVLINETEAIITKSVNVGQDPNGTYTNNKHDGIAFLTTTTLSGTGTYTSSLISTDGFSQIETLIHSNQSGSLVGRWYDDSNKTNLIRTFTRPYNGIEVSGTSYFSSPVFGPYVEYTYTNGSIAQTSFLLEFNLRTKPISGQVLGVNDFIPSGVVANLGRNIIVGQDTAGNFRNSSVDAEGHLKVHIDEPLAAFGELRTAEITPISQITHPYEINYDLISSGGTGSGFLSYDSTNTLVEINSGSATTSSSFMKTNSFVKYRNGQGLLIRFTSVFDTPKLGNTQWAGWGDSEGGFFFGYSGTTFGVMRRYNSVDNFTPQTSWSVDKWDGSSSLTNPSGELLIPQFGNVYEMQIQWLGYGAVRFNVESNESGQFEPAHVLDYANQNLYPTVTNPSFPIYFESKNTTNNTNVVIKNASLSAFIEGRVAYTGRNYSFRRAVNPGTGPTNIFTINVPSTYKGKTNRSRILLKTYSAIADGTNSVTYQFVKGATITSPTYNSVSTYSIVSADTAGSYTASSGRVLYTLELNKSSNATGNIQDLEIFVNAGETLSVIGSGSNTGAAIALSWVEDV